MQLGPVLVVPQLARVRIQTHHLRPARHPQTQTNKAQFGQRRKNPSGGSGGQVNRKPQAPQCPGSEAGKGQSLSPACPSRLAPQIPAD